MTLVLSATTISVQAESIERGASQSVQLSLQNFAANDSVYVGGSYSTNGIQQASLSVSGTTVNLFIGFRNPFETPPGTYVDTVTVRACRESPCVNHIAGSPKTITVNYTVVTPQNPPRMTLQTDSISLERFVLDTTAPPIQNVDVTFANMGSNTAPFVSAASASGLANVIGNTLMAAVPNPLQRLSLSLPPPSALGTGTHTDVLTVRGCLDVNCFNEVAGSPATIQVTYAVSNSVAGPGGFTAREVAAQANDIVWDEARQVFYVSIKSNALDNADTIGVLDPATGVIAGHAYVGSNPGDMRLSPDGQYLYVALRGAGVIQRRLLPSLAPDLTIALGTRPGDDATLYAKEFHVAPDAPRTIAVVRSTHPVASSYEYDLAVFDDAVMRPQTVGAGMPGRVTSFQWDTGTRIFGVNTASTEGSAYQLAVDAGGVAVTASQPGVVAFDHAARLVDGRMMMQSGRVFDPLTFGQLGTFAHGTPFGVVMTPDAATGKAFFLIQETIRAFDLDTLAPIASIAIPGAAPSTFNSRLVRWGRDGLALLNYQNGPEGILLINGPFVQP